MSRQRTPVFTLTHKLLAEHGSPVICIDDRAIGKRFRLYSERPDASMNELVSKAIRDDVLGADGGVVDVTPSEQIAFTRVTIRGPIEQRADEYCGWSDGHDAIADRMISALEAGNVLMDVDSPGGAHAGLQVAIDRVLEAKSRYGRKVVAYANEMIGSAAYWWVASVADEIYGPEAMLVGSIGARAGHQSVAGALEKAGIETTYFTWPGPGKVAFAPEMPLSELGRQRGDRDVTMAGESFAAAVSKARGISVEDIVALDADVLSGQLAVDAGLVDGIATIEEIEDYLLALAGTEGESMAKMKSAEAPKTPDEARAEEEKPEQDTESESSETEDEDDEPEKDSEAGEETEPEEEGDDEPEKEDEEDEDEDEEEDDVPPKKEKKAKVSAKKSASASVASLLGLHANASLPAVKSAAIAHSELARAVMSATNTKSPSEALGAFRGLVDDAAEAGKLREQNKDLKRAASYRERMDLLTKLAAADVPGYSRGELFVDEEADGKVVSKPSAVYSEMKLSTLRGLVSSKLKSGSPKKSSNPFSPSKEKAEEGKLQARVESASDSPFIAEAASRSRASRDDLARSAAALEAAGML